MKRGPLTLTGSDDIAKMTPKMPMDDGDCVFVNGDMSIKGVMGEKVSDEPMAYLDFVRGVS